MNDLNGAITTTMQVFFVQADLIMKAVFVTKKGSSL